jgi:hypothetical protein
VLGQCVRLALLVGTELLFSPVRHPQKQWDGGTLPSGLSSPRLGGHLSG